MGEDIIRRFEGSNYFLSNYYPCQIEVEGINFPSVEHAYQALKTSDLEIRNQIKNCDTPGEARALIKKITPPEDWEENKIGVMYKIIEHKFSSNEDLMDKLVATGEAPLIAGNESHNNYWGNCTCKTCKGTKGENRLGKILMQIRSITRQSLDKQKVQSSQEENDQGSNMPTPTDKSHLLTRAPIFNQQWKITETISKYFSDEDYLPLLMQDIAPEREVTFNLYLKTKFAGQNQVQYSICCPQGSILPWNYAQRIQKYGIRNLYYPKQEQADVLNYLKTNLFVDLKESNLESEKKAQRIYETAIVWVRHFFTEDKARIGDQISMGHEFVEHLLDNIPQDNFSNWLTAICRQQPTVYNHCLNVCLLAMTFAKYLGWPVRDLNSLGVGALLHDIGMTQIPNSILFKNCSLSNSEIEQVQKHPAIGFKLLSEGECSKKIDNKSMLTVLQHHENVDGSGYPNKLRLPQIEPCARVLRVIDSYEALVSPRPWRPGFTPKMAINIMTEEWREKRNYDNKFLRAFIKFLSS
jgi:hypothetical protein